MEKSGQNAKDRGGSKMVEGNMERVKGQSNDPSKVFNTSGNKKPLRYSHDSLTQELIGKTANIGLVNGSILNGKLIEIGMYDILIEVRKTEEILISGSKMMKEINSKVIVLKSAIMTVEVIS